MQRFFLWVILAGMSVGYIQAKPRHQETFQQKEIYKKYIIDNYGEQLTSPEKKKRLSFAQFGYGLYYTKFPLFPITGFINPDDYGTHSYGEPDAKEKNGALYTCRGGFIDFSHMRAGIDWTVYLAFKIICDGKDVDLPSQDGKMELQLKNIKNLQFEDIVALSQKIAFERLVWHELCSWYYHAPNKTFNEQQSTFTPEDNYSNFLGTVIGKNIVIRILEKQEGLSFEEIATDEIKKQIAVLLPVSSKKQSMEAYDIVDSHKQSKLPKAERNKDVWWNSKILFSDQRYVFKRYTVIGPQLSPWLVPKSSQLGCENIKMETLYVPQKTKAGSSFYTYYSLLISPDSSLFYNKKNNEELHKPFKPFLSKNMDQIVTIVSREMQQELYAGFNKRNKVNPEKKFDKVKKTWF